MSKEDEKRLKQLLQDLFDDGDDVAIIKKPKPRPPFPMDCCTYNYLST